MFLVFLRILVVVTLGLEHYSDECYVLVRRGGVWCHVCLSLVSILIICIRNVLENHGGLGLSEVLCVIPLVGVVFVREGSEADGSLSSCSSAVEPEGVVRGVCC